MPSGQNSITGRAHNFKDLTGQRFGKRVVLSWNSSPVYRGKRGSSRWNALCACGKECVVTTSTLRKSPSCGCDLEYTKRSGQSRRSKLSIEERRVIRNDSRRRRMFKITPKQFDKVVADQNNKCKICDIEFSRTPTVDHDHACCPGVKSCGKCIRGLLCNNCNAGLGNLKDNISVLQRAIDYLKQPPIIL